MPDEEIQEKLRPVTVVYEGPEIGRDAIREIERGIVAGLDKLGLARASAAPGVMKKTVEHGYLEVTVRVPVPLLRHVDPEKDEVPGAQIMNQIRAAEREIFGVGVRQAIARTFIRWRSKVTLP